MATLSLQNLLIILVLLLIMSAFFSGSETGMMALNRYRLRHLARSGNKQARRVQKLLDRTDRLLGVILIGNTFANILASAVVTVLAVNLYGDFAVLPATLLLTFAVLIFAEIAPKTVAAFYPQRFAFWAALPLSILLKVLYPFVWLANTLANTLLRLFGINVAKQALERLSAEELRTLVLETRGRIPPQHQDMLLRILDLEEVTVDDVMVPRNEIVGIDRDAKWDKILDTLMDSPHRQLPVYQDDIDAVQGFVNATKLLQLMADSKLSKETLNHALDKVYYIPEGTPLTTQLINFRKVQQHSGLVVDEYGDIIGLVTIADIVEEIVGEFSSLEPSISEQIEAQSDGSYTVDGAVNLRELNRLMHWELPTEGPKTLSGLIIERLETIPDSTVCLSIDSYRIEILSIDNNRIIQAKIWPISSGN